MAHSFFKKHMWPWEKRLNDLHHALEACHATYFDPELFNRNLNNFLQTSRTISFLIQKNKSVKVGLEAWYEENARKKWQNDTVMTWAKNARNVIEKQGDLEIGSTHTATLIFSYLPGDDVVLELPHDHLVRVGTKRLIRIAQKRLPSTMSDTAVVKIERKWADSKLPSHELLDALGHVYKSLHLVCSNLAKELETEFPPLPAPDAFLGTFNGRSRIRYLKLNGGKTVTIELRRVPAGSKAPQLPSGIGRAWRDAERPDGTAETLFDIFIRIVEATFLHSSFHQTMFFLLDHEFKPHFHISTEFADQAEKIIFFREAADFAFENRSHGAIFISEAWMRSANGYPEKLLRNLEIVGEQLALSIVDISGKTSTAIWNIARDSENVPSLSNPEIKRGVPFFQNFFFPIVLAMQRAAEEIDGINHKNMTRCLK